MLFISCYQGICKHTTETSVLCASALDLALLMGGATGGCEGEIVSLTFGTRGRTPAGGTGGTMKMICLVTNLCFCSRQSLEVFLLCSVQVQVNSPD